MNRSVGIVTALNPVLGYDKTTELAKEALQSGKGILELIREKKLLTEATDQRTAGSCKADHTNRSNQTPGITIELIINN